MVVGVAAVAVVATVTAVDKDVLDMVVVDGGVKRQKMANRRR